MEELYKQGDLHPIKGSSLGTALRLSAPGKAVNDLTAYHNLGLFRTLN